MPACGIKMLPNFLGIGVPKAGTTWLYDLLESHPQVFVTQKIKEVRYFNAYYQKGINWYQDFFPADTRDVRYSALGEITPHYLYCQSCPERIIEQLGSPKLILILRNPINRAWSDYVFKVRIDNYRDSFENFLLDYPTALNEGYYFRPTANYLHHFSRDQMLVLIFEKVFADVIKARERLAHFLEIDPALFPQSAGFSKSNRGYVPRFRALAAFSNSTLELALRNEQYWLINLAKRSGLKRLLSIEGNQLQPMREETRQELQKKYTQDITALEGLLEMDLGHWKV